MTSWVMVQVCVNVFLALGLGFVFIRMMRPAKDDPRMSRGLQLLQNKIAILEDLSDRTDHQFKQMGLLLDEKSKDVQNQISNAQEHIYRLGESMKKSQDVAKIFQDKIPHEEIIERQNTIKYVKAAQMAHRGHSVSEIQNAVDLPASEIEFIAKVNKDRLMFSVERLPDWIKNELEPEVAPTPMIEKAYRDAFEPLPDSSQSLARIGEEFRKAVHGMELEPALDTEEQEELPPVPSFPASSSVRATPPEPMVAVPNGANIRLGGATSASGRRGIISAEVGQHLRKFEFPKVQK